MRDKTIFSDRTYTMEDTYNVKAIVLNRKPYSENDSRVIVYTYELGKLELVARGTKKIKSKLAGHLEPISITDIMVVRGRQYDYVGAAVSVQCYSNIKESLESLASAGRAVRAIDKLTRPGVADQETFGLLEDYLAAVNSSRADINILCSFFIFKLFARLGFMPELSFCTGCAGKIHPGSNRFDLDKGGLACPKCSDLKNKNQLIISDDSIKLLRLALKYNFKQLKKIKINKKLVKEISGIIDLFYSYNF